MGTRQYFAVSLLLPVALGLFGWAFEPLFVLSFGLVAGAVPYLPTAIVALVFIRRARTLGGLVFISTALPIAFALLLATFVGFNTHDAMISAGTAIGGLIVAYLYVGVAWATYLGLKAAGLVSNEFAT